jgi:hypothetical protein
MPTPCLDLKAGKQSIIVGVQNGWMGDKFKGLLSAVPIEKKWRRKT